MSGTGQTQCLDSLPERPDFAKSARGLKLQVAFAEDELVKWYLVQNFFGDLLKADHNVLGQGCESRKNHRYAVVGADWENKSYSY